MCVLFANDCVMVYVLCLCCACSVFASVILNNCCVSVCALLCDVV